MQEVATAELMTKMADEICASLKLMRTRRGRQRETEGVGKFIVFFFLPLFAVANKRNKLHVAEPERSLSRRRLRAADEL